MRYRIPIEFDAENLEDADHIGDLIAKSAKALAAPRNVAAGPIEQRHVSWYEPQRPKQS